MVEVGFALVEIISKDDVGEPAGELVGLEEAALEDAALETLLVGEMLDEEALLYELDCT